MNQNERFVMYVEQAKSFLEAAEALAVEENEHSRARYVMNALNQVNTLIHFEGMIKK